MNPVGTSEARRIAREHEAGTRRLRGADLAIETHLGRQQLELQRIALAREEVADLEPRRAGGGRGGRGRGRGLWVHRVPGTLERRAVRRARGVSFPSSSWRFTRAMAASSADQ